MLALTGCGSTVNQWLDPDRTFSTLKQPEIKSINDTQEDIAKEAVANNDYKRAQQFYSQLIRSDKATPEQKFRYELGLADATRRLGENEDALKMFEQLYKEKPDDPDVAEGRALCLLATGATTEASRAFAAITEKYPDRWRTLNALGILFVTKNMIPEATAYFNEGLKKSPDNTAILNNMGLAQAVDHQYARAVELLGQAARTAKSAGQRQQIDLNLALVYASAGDLDRAQDIASKYYEGAALDNNLGLYAHLAKDDGLAKTYLNMALTQSPQFYERAWSNLDIIGGNAGPESADPAPPRDEPKKRPAEQDKPDNAAPRK